MNPEHNRTKPHFYFNGVRIEYDESLPSDSGIFCKDTDRANPQRAIDEYKKNTKRSTRALSDLQGSDISHLNKFRDAPPLIKLGQGREEQPSDKTVEVIYVSFLVGGLIALLMFVCYLAGGWQ